MGIGPEAQREPEEANWWDREDALAPPESRSIPMGFARQAELFDESGQAAYQPLVRPPLPVADAPPEIPPAARTIPQTIVSVRSKSKTTARVVATTRVAPAVRVASVAKAASPVRGAVARQLVMSQSISSGREEARWFSVPQRALLPRFQLFEGSDAVTEDKAGGLRIDPPAMRTQNGRVWFV